MFGISAALTTPFLSGNSVDFVRFNNHIRSVLSKGCSSVTMFGTTGEGPSVSCKMRLDTLRAVIDEGINPASLVLTLHGTAATDIVDQVEAAMSLGVRKFLLPPPGYFNDPTSSGLSAWFGFILSQFKATNAQFILYHIPQVIGVGLSIDLVSQLKYAFPKLVYGVKDSSGVFEYTEKLLQLPGLKILVGDERQLASCVRIGASGSISGVANVFSNRLARVLATGNDDAKLNQLVDTLLNFPVTPAIKSMVAYKYNAKEWRNTAPPLEPLSDEDYARIEAACKLVSDSD